MTLKKAIEEVLGVDIRRKAKPLSKRVQLFSTHKEAQNACQSSGAYENQKLVDVIFEKTKRYIKELDTHPVHINKGFLSSLTTVLQLAQTQRSFSVLDFGGACGFHYWLVRKLVSPEVKIQWCVVESSAMSAKAQALSNDELSFFDDIHKAKVHLQNKSGTIDLVFSSSTLHSSHPIETLKTLASCGAKEIGLFRSSFSPTNQSVIFVQNSKFSENGVGPLPPGFEDVVIQYPHVAVPREKVIQTLKEAGYSIAINYDSVENSIDTNLVGLDAVFRYEI